MNGEEEPSPDELLSSSACDGPATAAIDPLGDRALFALADDVVVGPDEEGVWRPVGLVSMFERWC